MCWHARVQLHASPGKDWKLWWVWACERKKRAIFVPFILSKENFFRICVLSQCMVYWIHFQNIHTFTYQKTLVYTFFLLVFKIAKNLQCIFKSNNLYQITNANNINSKRLYENKYENIVYENYNNSQIDTDLNTIGSNIWNNSTSLKG